MHPDLPSDFPPPRALGVVAHNLPFLRAALVGRETERAALADLLPATGLLTVVGPGGVGKTRLAVQVGFDVMDDYDDGAWMVELAPLTDAGLVPGAVAAVVGVAEQPGRGIEDLLVESLAPRSMLLLLDNCEHLLDAVAALVERLSRHCPHLVVLVTSREPLDIDGEAVWRLAPLPTIDLSGELTAARVGAVDGRPAVRGAGRPRPAGLPAHRRERGVGRPAGRPPRRHAAGHRARRGRPDRPPAVRPCSRGSPTASPCSAGDGGPLPAGTRPCAPPWSGASTC